MKLTESIFRNIKESESVKKPYGDKPQEGKKEKLEKGKRTSVPKGKADNKFKVEKLQNVNSQAADIYPNDTAKNVDRIGSKEHSDKGKIAKQNTTKASSTVNKPFGDKIQASDSKLIKEGANCDGEGCNECDKPVEECDEKLTEEFKEGIKTISRNEEFNIGGLLEAGYNKIISFDKYTILANDSNVIVIEKGSPNYATKYNKDDNYEDFTSDEYNILVPTEEK